jgi:hypothetical protein
MSHVNFFHDVRRERGHQRHLDELRAWFRKQKMPVNLPLPSSTVFDPRRPSIKTVQTIEKAWQKKERAYFSIVQRFATADIRKSYITHVSLFGPEGQFRRPNILFLRLDAQDGTVRVVETIAHELLHLILYRTLARLSYEEREGTVDQLFRRSRLKKLFPRYTLQSIGKPHEDTLQKILTRHSE